jgi:hypothetical protein
MNFVVTLAGEVRATGDDLPDVDKLIESHLDDVMDELGSLGADDPGIELDLDRGEVTFSVLVGADNPVGAINQASTLLRTAIHAAKGATPDWPGPQEDCWYVRLLSVRSDLVEAPELVKQ